MRRKKMPWAYFVSICGEFLIEPAIALENARVIAAVRAVDYDALRLALTEEF